MSKLQVILGIAMLIVAVAGYQTIQMNICDCEADKLFTKIGKNHYLFIEQKVNWFQASNICRANNADLASIESLEELHTLSHYLVEKGTTASEWFWIDGNDLATEGSFFYSSITGLSMIFAKWSAGQPDDAGGNEDCVHLWLQSGTFEMNDWNCNGLAYAICKARKPNDIVVNAW